MTAFASTDRPDRNVVKSSHIAIGLPALLSPSLIIAAAIALTHSQAGWPQMWATAFGLYFACKAWVLIIAARGGARFDARRVSMFVVAWAGMDPRPFAIGAPSFAASDRVEPISWLEGLIKLLTGVALLLLSPIVAARFGEQVAMWVCVSAYCLILHFGLLHLIGFAWQKRGVAVEAVMQQPARSSSLADFWSRRWNRAFRDVSNALVIRPTRRYLGPAGAVGLVFVGSGLVHELLMSWPARGGWGLPTLYFTLQGAGVLFERSRFGTRLGLTSTRHRRVRTADLPRATGCLPPSAPARNAPHVPSDANPTSPTLHYRVTRSTDSPRATGCLPPSASASSQHRSVRCADQTHRGNAFIDTCRPRVWTALVVIAPLPLLVHEPFVNNVVIPFFKFLGAI